MTPVSLSMEWKKREAAELWVLALIHIRFNGFNCIIIMIIMMIIIIIITTTTSTTIDHFRAPFYKEAPRALLYLI